MRLSTRVHGMLDYLVGALLIGAPWILGFSDGGAACWVPVVLGASVILYSLFTDYELGLVRRIDMPIHLWLDGIGGLALAVSPWVLGFDDRVWVPHLAVGLTEILVAVVTQTIPSYDRRGGR